MRAHLARPLLAMVIAAVLLWAGFTTYALLGDNYQRVLPGLKVEPNEVDWQMLVGDGAVGEDGFAILGATERAHALLLAIRLPQTVEAESVERIELVFRPGVQYRRMNLGWSTSTTFPRSRMGPIDMISDTRGVVNTSWLPNWDGELQFMAVELFGGGDPVTLRRIELIPSRPDFFQFQRRLIGEWFESPPWTQRSTHHTRVSLHREILSPVVAVASWAGLSILLLLAAPWFRAGFPMALLVLVPVAFGWLALDLRWQVDLAGKAWRAVDSMAGKSWQEKQVGSFDGDLFRLVKDLEEMVESEPPRVFAVGYGEFWRLRARYHAGAWPVRTTDQALEGWVRHLREGDLVMLLDAPGVERLELRDTTAPDSNGVLVDSPLEEVVGPDAELIEVDGQELVALQPGGRVLLRSRFPAAPASGVHAMNVRLAAGVEPVTVRLRVRRHDGSGNRFTLAERSLVVEGRELRNYRLAFPIERGGVYEVVVLGEEGAELYAAGLRVERVADDELIYLRSDPEKAGVIVRPILERDIGSVYEVM